PVPGSLGLLPSGPDPVGEWIVHQPTSRSPYRQSASQMQGQLHAGRQRFACRARVHWLALPANEGTSMPPVTKTGFELDARLETTSHPVFWLGLSELRLVDERRWPWLLLVPQR